MKLVNSGSNVTTLDTTLSQRQDQFLHNLTLSLTAGLENPFGAEMGVMICRGLERTNREAVASWVRMSRQQIVTVSVLGINVRVSIGWQLLTRIELNRGCE